MKKRYEVMYILDRDTANFEEQKQKMHAILIHNGGKVIEDADWGMINFAYPINKKTSGRYVVVIVDTRPENILEFQRVSKIDKNVVRFLVINTEKEINYVQNTKMSKTDMSKLIEEQKKYYENKNNRFDRERNNQNKEVKDEANNANFVDKNNKEKVATKENKK